MLSQQSGFFNISNTISLLQMQHSVFDFLGSSLVPELCSDISASSSCHRHFILILISAIRTFPDQFPRFVFLDQNLAAISAAFTIITLCIQLCIHNIIVNELHNGKHCRNIILHIRNFHVADCSTRRQFLEISLEFQFIECVDFFCHMHMVAVCNIVFICNSLNDAKT